MILWVLIGVFVLIVSLFLIRLFSEKQLDDVSSGIACEEWLLEDADVYFVIPQFEGVEIDKEWCGDILEREKELALHGVEHSFEEFGADREEEYLQEGIDIFKECFGFEAERFKPPQLVISKGNKKLIKKKMKLDGWLKQILHKVYHCEDSGLLPNCFVRIF